jgi:hypothetical protein
MEHILPWSLPIALATVIGLVIRRGWNRRHIDGWHFRARWLRRLEGEDD